MMITGNIRLQTPRFADHGQAVDARHLEVRDQEVVGNEAEPLERRAPVGRQIDVVFGERERLREEIANRRLVVDDEDAGPARGRRRRARRAGSALRAWRGR